ncbi:MAG: AAA family ATPase [Candidatus Aenigmarchaeota archaeon]|nr:AAA family ATPase [Candidatus Aenigmarchaeota archaeon]
MDNNVYIPDPSTYQKSNVGGVGSDEEVKQLKSTVLRMQAELKRFENKPLLVGEVISVFENNEIMVKLKNGNVFCVGVKKGLEDKLNAGDEILLEQKNLTVIRKLGRIKNYDVEKFVIMEKPTVSWKDIGGLEKQILELKEVIEMPLKNPEKFRKIGIVPPNGVLLHGPPGTGKTILAKAVANSTDATFIEIVGSELVQKFIGQGAKLVKSIFQMAKEKAPTIIFIDEIDSIAATRVEMGTSGEREVQRTFMQLLAEIDGFDPLGDVKIIGATNRLDILDAAVIRPGRLDRLVEVDLPGKGGAEQILKIHTKNMKLEKDVNISKIVSALDEMSGAEIRAVAVEAGYFAMRAGRVTIKMKDFESAVSKVRDEEEGDAEYLHYIN